MIFGKSLYRTNSCMPSSPPSPTVVKSPRNVHLWEGVAVRELVILGLVVCFLWLCFQLQAILIPILIGLGLAYLTDPALDYVKSHGNFPDGLPSPSSS